MTSRQHVLQLYPNARLSRGNGGNYSVYYIDESPRLRGGQLFGCGTTAKEAWESAWNVLQRLMLEKLCE